MTPGTYIRLRREAAGLSIDDLALFIDTNLKVAARERAELLRLIEADVAVISADVVQALVDLGKMGAFSFSAHILWQLIAIHAGAEILAPEVCARCACSWTDPCIGHDRPACAWADDTATLCTACAVAPPTAGDTDADQGAPSDGRSVRGGAPADGLAAVRPGASLVADDLAQAVNA